VRLSEIFVPYNNGTRIYDLGARGRFELTPATKKEAGAHGVLLDPFVVKEVRDAGLAWKFYDKVRRGQELVLWATLGAANYNYVMQYGFRDEGTVTCRLGATGQNLQNHTTVGHMHNGCWRIHPSLDGDRNTVKLVRHEEPLRTPQGKESAREIELDFNRGVEGGDVWVAREFTTLRVVSPRKNAHGHPMSYDLLPHLRPGTPRHSLVKQEAFTQFDFWVTPFRWNEQHYVQLPRFVAQKRPIRNTDVVLWYMAPMHHVPRDEDGIFPAVAGQPVNPGITQLMWGGFDLRPRNLFDATPLFP
jgi:primary-amine oxidase